MSLAAGRLRHQVVIEVPLQTTDPDTGEVFTTYSAWRTVWAAIEPLSAREFIAAQAQQSEVRGKIIIRAIPGLLPTVRVNHNGLIYQVFGVIIDPDSGLEWMTLPVGQGVIPPPSPEFDSSGEPVLP